MYSLCHVMPSCGSTFKVLVNISFAVIFSAMHATCHTLASGDMRRLFTVVVVGFLKKNTYSST